MVVLLLLVVPVLPFFPLDKMHI